MKPSMVFRRALVWHSANRQQDEDTADESSKGSHQQTCARRPEYACLCEFQPGQVFNARWAPRTAAHRFLLPDGGQNAVHTPREVLQVKNDQRSYKLGSRGEKVSPHLPILDTDSDWIIIKHKLTILSRFGVPTSVKAYKPQSWRIKELLHTSFIM